MKKLLFILASSFSMHISKTMTEQDFFENMSKCTDAFQHIDLMRVSDLRSLDDELFFDSYQDCVNKESVLERIENLAQKNLKEDSLNILTEELLSSLRKLEREDGYVFQWLIGAPQIFRNNAGFMSLLSEILAEDKE